MKNVIITGGNSGLGFETAKKVAARSDDYRVIIACRNEQKSMQAKKEITAVSGNTNIEVMTLDTSSLSSVRKFVQDYKEKGYGNVYALLCNAGISGSHTGITDDGFDVVFETNHLGHFLLTNLLLPLMDPQGLIFATSSDMHDSPSGNMIWRGTDFLAYPNPSFAKSRERYSYSKLCNLYFIYELAEKLSESGSRIRANAFNPGLMQTNFTPVSRASLEFVRYMMPKRYGDLGKSSSAYAQLVTEPELVSQSGQYYDRSIYPADSSDLSYSVANRRELWEKSCEYTGIKNKEVIL